jgi:dTMP kinase
MAGFFITFEGAEGSGKSTLVGTVANQLRKMAGKVPSVLQTREPGGSPLAEKIRSLLIEEKMSGVCETLLLQAARADHVVETIHPALLEGKIVLCDRFTDSTLAYQGYARGMDLQWLEDLNQKASLGLLPDLTVLLDCRPQIGLKRAKDPNRFELEGLDFHEKVFEGFHRAKDRYLHRRWLVLDSETQSLDDLTKVVVDQITQLVSDNDRKKTNAS